MSKPRKEKPSADKLYRLRDPLTGLFLGIYHNNIPTFTSPGKDWKTVDGARDELLFYNYQRIIHPQGRPPTSGAPKAGAGKTALQNWPSLEIVSYAMQEVATESDTTGDLKHAAKFIKKCCVNDYGSVPNFVKRMAAQGTTFRYLIWAEGSHPITDITPVTYQRNGNSQRWDDNGRVPVKGETIVCVNSDTDLMYLKLKLNDHLITIWDYEGCVTLDNGVRQLRKKRR